MKLDPKNLGVMLRRKLDYQFPNQRAKVFIADASTSKGTPAGSDWPELSWTELRYDAYCFVVPEWTVGAGTE